MDHTTPPGSPLSLARRHEHFDAVASGRRLVGGPDFHAAILARVAANHDIAESAGWTACAIDVVPDWTVGTDPGMRPMPIAGGA